MNIDDAINFEQKEASFYMPITAQYHLQLVEWLKELKEYQVLKNSGSLLKLPCKVGDTVYYFSGSYYKDIKNWKIEPIKVTEFNIKVNKSGKLMPLAMIANGTRYPISSVGKTVFLTKSEAEETLKKLKSTKYDTKSEEEEYDR